MATRGAVAACLIWKHRRNHSFRSLSSQSHRFNPNFNPQIIRKGFRYQIRAIHGASADPIAQLKNNDDPKQKPQNWKIKMLYDGDCPLCMREVNMLMERNEKHGSIKFVDISSNDYSPEDNQGLGYKTVMGTIHAIQSDGNVVTGVEAFRRLYEEVGLGWVYTITKFEPDYITCSCSGPLGITNFGPEPLGNFKKEQMISCNVGSTRSFRFLFVSTAAFTDNTQLLQIGKVADAVYDFWAKYRLQVTGRPSIEAILEARKKNKVETCGDSNECKM